MASPPEKSSRRGVLASTLVGVIAGGAWGAAIQAFSRPRDPRLSVIGAEGNQLALLDTTEVRILLLLGNPNSLVDNLSVLMTTFRQRIDLVIGADAALLQAMGRVRERWNVRHTLAIPDGTPIHYDDGRTTRVSVDTSVEVGSRGVLNLRTTTRNAWRSDVPGRYLWIASWMANDYRIVLGPDARSIRTLAAAGSALVVVPHADPIAIDAEVRPAAIAVNRGDEPFDVPAGVQVVRVYPGDVAEFDLLPEGVRLPSWSD